jgi:hypothetical protein
VTVDRTLAVPAGEPDRSARATAPPFASGSRVVGILVLVEAALFVAYWTVWAIDDSLVAADDTAGYAAFEALFPLPDGFLALSLLVSGRYLLAGRARALPSLFVAAGAGIFLALVDIAYDMQNDIWARGATGALELAIVTGLLAAHAGYIVWGWRSLRGLVRDRADW